MAFRFPRVLAFHCDGGMGQVTLSDVARVLSLSNLAKFRLDAISFFLVMILGSCSCDFGATFRPVRPRD